MSGNPIFNGTRVNDFPSMAVDKSSGTHRGRIYITLPAKEGGNGKSVIQVCFSDNQGNTWSNLNTISIPNGRQNWFPWITVDDINGDVWVIYYSFDTPSGFETNTYVAHSSDNGVTWENQKVSDVGHITAPIPGPFSTGYAGDYLGIAAHGGKAYPIWMDDRNGTWQLYCSPVTTCTQTTATNLLTSNAVYPYGPNSYYGYYINFTSISGITNYIMEWFDVTTNSLQSTYPITYTGFNSVFYYYFTAGHTYKYRVKADCNNSPFSNWSDYLLPPAQTASCSTGPISSTLTQYLGCGYYTTGCPYTNLSWPAISGATDYQVQYNVFNTSTGFSYPTFTSTTSYTGSPVYNTVGLPYLTGTGWYINYRVAAKCSGTYGNYSGWSSTFFLQ